MRRPRILLTLLAGLFLGALAALVTLWPYPLSVRGVGATLAGGGVFGVVLATSVVLTRRLSSFALFALSAVAGGFGGTAWWFVIRPATSLVVGIVIGGVVAIGVLALEELFWQAAA